MGIWEANSSGKKKGKRHFFFDFQYFEFKQQLFSAVKVLWK